MITMHSTMDGENPYDYQLNQVIFSKKYIYIIDKSLNVAELF